MIFYPCTDEEIKRYHEEATATAMLIGEPAPIICSCCLGRRIERRIFGWGRCGQCMGTGYDLMGPKTGKIMGLKDR